MYKAQNRLKKRKQFNYIHAKGVTISASDILFIRYTVTNSVNYKIGFSVSKKIGTAVTRNKVKRRLKEAMRQLGTDIPRCFYFVVIARPKIVEADFSLIKAELEKSISLMICKNEKK